MHFKSAEFCCAYFDELIYKPAVPFILGVWLEMGYEVGGRKLAGIYVVVLVVAECEENRMWPT